MKNKGFTLIELLAVIVILAVIVLIAIPVMLNVIAKAKLGSLKDSAYGMLESANLYYAQYKPESNIRFDINDNKVTSDETANLLKYKGNIESGTLILDKKGNTTLCITDGTNSAYKNYTEREITVVEKEKCYIPDNRTVVYLEGAGATRSELTNQELTDLVANLQEKIESLEAKDQELENTKANQSDLDTTNSNLQAVSTVANNANTLAINAATKTELNAINNKIYTPTNIQSSKQYTSESGVLAYRDLSVTIPANSYYVISATASWNHGKPQTLILSSSSTSAASNYCHNVVHDETNNLNCTIAGATGSSNSAFYYWSKHAGSGTNTAQIRGYYWHK